MSSNRLFKSHERKIAAMIGGHRTGHLGGSDVQTESLAIECKQSKQLPTWLWSAIQQAERHAADGQLPIVALHETNNKYNDDLVLMRFSTFERLINKDVILDE